jgi:hypothetical protein
MRIISQSGLLDVPYELIAISPYSGNMATIVGTFPGNDLGKGDRVYILAEYSTEEKAIKAMEMCRNRYAWCKIRSHGMNSLTMAMSFRKIDEIEQLLETFAEKNIFQFPADEEVEV